MIESDPRGRRQIARKGLDRTIPEAGIGPEDTYEGHEEEGWIARIEEGYRGS